MEDTEKLYLAAFTDKSIPPFVLLMILSAPSAELQAEAILEYIPGVVVERIEDLKSKEVKLLFTQSSKPHNSSMCSAEGRGLNMEQLLNILPEKKP